MDEARARWGDREALVFEGRRFSFRQLAAEVDRLAKGLIQLGVAPGEKVAIWLQNCPEWIHAMFACAKIGAVHVPVNTRLRTDDVAYVLRQSDSTTLITHDVSGPIDYLSMARKLTPVAGTLKRLVIKSERTHPGTITWADLLERAREVDDTTVRARAAAVRSTDTAFVMYTSGTTGFPKGVARDHGLIESLVDRQRRLGMTERDVFINYLPLSHIFGYVDGPLGSMMVGNRHVLTQGFDPDEALELIEREGGTQVHGFEGHLKALCDAQEAHPRDLRTLRAGLMALGQASATAYRARTVLAPARFLAAYGITEVGANVSVSLPDATEEQACETSGYPCEGFALRVVDPETGREQPRGVAGELLVQSRYMMQGYYRKPEETARALDLDGWFHTGDMAIVRADGYVRFVGRYKDMLKIGGENVDPMEVEGYLLQHPDVQQVAVVSYPDPTLTEVSVAFVQRRPGATVTEAEIVGSCRGRMASFKVPRHVVFMDELPVTSSGKIQKAILRERAVPLLDAGGAGIDRRGNRRM
ncbi:MAG: class I adenylate-forming enzyme family protein [Candidatus Rokuibacteriota bacterium]